MSYLIESLFQHLRQPYCQSPRQGSFWGYACATTITTLSYLCRKVVGKAKAEQLIRTLLSILDVASVNRRVIEKALQANFGDFEDAVLNEAALLSSSRLTLL